MAYGYRVCNFSGGLDDLPKAQQRDIGAVLRHLEQAKRFSVFKATANDRLARMMTDVMKSGYVRDLGGGYPWINVELTDTGRAIAHPTTSQQNKGDA